jgi:hypothetical protein
MKNYHNNKIDTGSLSEFRKFLHNELQGQSEGRVFFGGGGEGVGG